MVYGPFKNVWSVYDIAISLHVSLSSELKGYINARRNERKHRKENSPDYRLSLADAWRDIAYRHADAFRSVKRIADVFKSNLTPEGLEIFNHCFHIKTERRGNHG